MTIGNLAVMLQVFMTNWLCGGLEKYSENKSSELRKEKNAQYYCLCRIEDHLGSGQFGVVEKGVWYSPHGPVDVAIKTLKEESSEELTVMFLQEAAFNGQFQHPT